MAWLARKSSSSSSTSGFSSSSTAEEVTHGIDASNLTAIVTGSSSGVGAETARVLAMRGAQVVMAVRSVSSGEVIKQSILKETTSARVHVLQLDLGSMSSVRKFASEFKSLDLPLNILVNNAGIMGCPYELSVDGIELQFATNHVGRYAWALMLEGNFHAKLWDASLALAAGHFLLTELVLDDMKRTAQESGVEGRIVSVSSLGHYLPYRGGIRFDSLNDRSSYSAWKAYGQSKLANILHAKELTRRLQEEGVCITANALHPGAIRTGLQRHSVMLRMTFALFPFAWRSIPQGAATQCFLALHPFVKGVSGKYFVNCNESTPSSYGNNPGLAKALWEFSQKITSRN